MARKKRRMMRDRDVDLYMEARHIILAIPSPSPIFLEPFEIPSQNVEISNLTTGYPDQSQEYKTSIKSRKCK
jgi:hypothetical protein